MPLRGTRLIANPVGRASYNPDDYMNVMTRIKNTMDVRAVSLIALIISYFVVVGADVYGQMVVARAVLEAPPRSFLMLQGEHVLDSKGFWQIVTTIPLILFVLSIVANWKTRRRGLLLTAFFAFFVINALSFPFVFGEYLDIVSVGYKDMIDPELLERAAAWQRLALVRCAVVVAVGVLPLVALARSEGQRGGSFTR